VSSVEPSSTTITSRSQPVCARTLSIASSRYAARLYVVMAAVTSGTIDVYHTPRPALTREASLYRPPSVKAVLSSAARLPMRYGAALRTAARLKRRPPMTDAEALAWGQGLRWYHDELRVTQSREEIVWLLEKVRAERPRVVVEIGTDLGGTLFLWPYAAAEDALIVGVDRRPLGLLGRRSPYALVRRAFARGRQRVDLLMPVDSHDARTVDRLRSRLAGRPIDFLFIDADHSYEGVKRDFELYSPLVRPGGIVGFHDVSGEAWPGVATFFSELTDRYESDACTAATPPRYGIGIVRLPG